MIGPQPAQTFRANRTVLFSMRLVGRGALDLRQALGRLEVVFLDGGDRRRGVAGLGLLARLLAGRVSGPVGRDRSCPWLASCPRARRCRPGRRQTPPGRPRPAPTPRKTGLSVVLPSTLSFVDLWLTLAIILSAKHALRPGLSDRVHRLHEVVDRQLAQQLGDLACRPAANCGSIFCINCTSRVSWALISDSSIRPSAMAATNDSAGGPSRR